MPNPALKFVDYVSPTGANFHIPADITLEIPLNSSIDPRLLNRLTYIPWNTKYLDKVPWRYKKFFSFVLPKLSTRTTDVHVAICLPLAEQLIRRFDGVDERVVNIALILHDIGWSELSDNEVASSLGVEGLELSAGAIAPKEKHAAVGRELAEKILETYQFEPELTAEQKELILDAVLFHDKPWELAVGGDIPLEVKLVCDADHLWSFTYENFWQDTVRKNVDPHQYLQNLSQDLDGYFVTDEAKIMAKELLSERANELAQL